MKKMKYIYMIMLALFAFTACGDDSASNPKFGDEDIPRILIDWTATRAAVVGGTLDIKPPVSPADGATFKWMLNGTVIAKTQFLEYTLTEAGVFELRFEVDRNGIGNFRTQTLTVTVPIP